MFCAVCNVNGPISVRFEGETEDQAIAEFEAGNHRAWIDEARTDAEDDLDIAGDGMTEGDFDDAMLAAGGIPVRDLAAIENAHAGTVAHLADGWFLWRLDQ